MGTKRKLETKYDSSSFARVHEPLPIFEQQRPKQRRFESESDLFLNHFHGVVSSPTTAQKYSDLCLQTYHNMMQPPLINWIVDYFPAQLAKKLLPRTVDSLADNPLKYLGWNVNWLVLLLSQVDVLISAQLCRSGQWAQIDAITECYAVLTKAQQQTFVEVLVAAHRHLSVYTYPNSYAFIRKHILMHLIHLWIVLLCEQYPLSILHCHENGKWQSLDSHTHSFVVKTPSRCLMTAEKDIYTLKVDFHEVWLDSIDNKHTLAQINETSQSLDIFQVSLRDDDDLVDVTVDSILSEFIHWSGYSIPFFEDILPREILCMIRSYLYVMKAKKE
jgi:hypothetical protein